MFLHDNGCLCPKPELAAAAVATARPRLPERVDIEVSCCVILLVSLDSGLKLNILYTNIQTPRKASLKASLAQ